MNPQGRAGTYDWAADLDRLEKVNADLLAACEAALSAIHCERTLGHLKGTPGWENIETVLRDAIRAAKEGQ